MTTSSREEGLAAAILEETLRAGAREAEVLVKRGVSSELHVHQRRLESVSAASETGIGIRFFLPGGRSGYVHTAETDPIRIRRILEEAMPGAEETDGDETRGLPDPPQDAAALPSGDALGAYDRRSALTTTPERIEFLRRVEEAVLESDARVGFVDSLFLLDGRSRVWLRNSRGFAGTFRRSLTTLVLSVVAREEDLSLMSFHEKWAHALPAMDPQEIGEAAAFRASAPLGGRRIAPQRLAVAFDPPAATVLLRHIAPSFLADVRQRGRSLFPGGPGEKVASEAVTIVDDGRVPGGLATTPFDGEGVPTRRTVLVENGILRGALYDTRAGRAEGKPSTGNSVRRSYREVPQLGVTNFMILPGSRPTGHLLREQPALLRVLNVMQVGGIHPVTGDLSIAASGLWLERGREVHPVSGITISGNLREMLLNVAAVGDDLDHYHEEGAFGSPTLIIEGLTAAG